MPTTCPTALFLFFITFSTLLSTPKCMVQVKYSKDPVRRTEGQPLTLKCTAEYEEEQCSGIEVSWCLLVSVCQPLTDPDKYLIHVNETKISGKTGFRQRDAFITFTQLTLGNSGIYQCKAECERTGTSAIGRLINVTVTGEASKESSKDQKILNQSDRCSADIFLVTMSVFIPLCIHKM